MNSIKQESSIGDVGNHVGDTIRGVEFAEPVSAGCQHHTEGSNAGGEDFSSENPGDLPSDRLEAWLVGGYRWKDEE